MYHTNSTAFSFSKYCVFSWISDIFVLFKTFSIDFYLLFLSSSMSSLSVAMKSSSSSNTPAITTSLIYYPSAAAFWLTTTQNYSLCYKKQIYFSVPSDCQVDGESFLQQFQTFFRLWVSLACCWLSRESCLLSPSWCHDLSLSSF